MKPVPLSTDEVQGPRFPAHGVVRYWRQGRCLGCDAVGPFNEELVQILAHDMIELFAQMAQGGAWVHLARFRGSALASPATLAQLSLFLAGLKAKGHGPEAATYVLASDVEGAQIMRSPIQRCFEAAGIPFAVFESEAGARAWLHARHPDLPQS